MTGFAGPAGPCGTMFSKVPQRRGAGPAGPALPPKGGRVLVPQLVPQKRAMAAVARGGGVENLEAIGPSPSPPSSYEVSRVIKKHPL